MIESQEIEQIAVYEEYKTKMDTLYPSHIDRYNDFRIKLDELFHMGFTQFQINKILLSRFDGDLNQTCQILVDENALIRDFGMNYQNDFR